MARIQDLPMGAGFLWILAAHFLGVSSLDHFEIVKNSSTGICQSTMDRCKEEFDSSQSLYAKKDYCRFLNFRENRETMYQCLVQNGFCTDLEFNKLIAASCRYRHQQPINAARQTFYSSVSVVSKNCQHQFQLCVRNSFIATVSMQNQKYCPLLNSSVYHRDCLAISSHCTEAELRELQNIACIQSEPGVKQTFSSALVSRSETCQSAIENCITNSDSAIAYTRGQNYYALMHSDSDEINMIPCLVRYGQCTESDIRDMKVSACKSSSLMYSRNVFMSLPWLYKMLLNII